MKAKLYNNYDFNKSVPSLAKDEIKTFVWLKQVPDPDNKGRIKMPRWCNVPPTDLVYVPKDYSKDPTSASDEMIHIAYVIGEKADGEATLGEILTGAAMLGTIDCVGSKKYHKEKFRFLWLSNYNQSNPLRDNSIEPLYRFDDPGFAAKSKRDARKAKKDVYDMLNTISEDWLREIATSYVKDSKTTDIEVIKDKMEEEAETDAKTILSLITDKKVGIVNTLKAAQKAGIIQNSTKDRIFTFKDSGEEIYNYKDLEAKKSPYEPFAVAIEGQPELLQAIETKLKAKTAE